MRDPSARAVSFICSLSPAFWAEEGRAVCLQSGVRFCATETPEDADPIVRLQFGALGSPGLEVPAGIAAGLAITSYIRLAAVGLPDGERCAAIEDLANHCTFKTGVVPYVPYMSDTEHPSKVQARRYTDLAIGVFSGGILGKL